MRLDFLILTDAANTSEGKLNLTGAGITRLNFPQIPFILPQVYMVARLVVEDERDLGTHALLFEWHRPNGDLLVPAIEGSVEVTLPPSLAPDEEHAIMAIVGFAMIPFEQDGRHECVVRLDGEIAGVRPLVVVQVSPDLLRPG